MNKSSTLLRILLIEDSDTDAYIIEKAIKRFKPDSTLQRASTLKAGEDILQAGGADVVLLDLGLPDSPTPKDSYEHIKKWSSKLPIIIMTSLKDHDLARVMIQEGAADFLNKDAITQNPKLVQNTVDFSIARHATSKSLVTAKEKAESESKQKDTVLRCFMGGYTINDGSGK